MQDTVVDMTCASLSLRPDSVALFATGARSTRILDDLLRKLRDRGLSVDELDGVSLLPLKHRCVFVVCCSAVQCVAGSCSVLQFVAYCVAVLQRVAACIYLCG